VARRIAEQSRAAFTGPCVAAGAGARRRRPTPCPSVVRTGWPTAIQGFLPGSRSSYAAAFRTSIPGAMPDTVLSDWN